MSDDIEMTLAGVRIELPSQQPIVLLREKSGERYLPIYVGSTEASSIALVLQGQQAPRPLTHDLLRATLEDRDIRVSRVTITELRDGTFYAEIRLSGDGRESDLDARPSDAVALALRVGSPIFATARVLGQAGILMPEAEGDEEEEVERFREFLENVDPGDFESS